MILRSLAFNLLLWAWTFLIATLWLPLFLGPLSLRRRSHPVWASGSVWLMRTIMGIRYEFIGLENLPSGACVLASKHQSAWETIAFGALFDPVVFVLKKQLTRIPFFGWALIATGQIIIDRADGVAAMRHIIREGERARAQGVRIPIFPEGTRVKVGEKPPLLPGVVGLARHLGLPVVPVAVNSGLVWPRASFWKRSGTITVRVFPPVSPTLDKRAMLTHLHACINVLDKSDHE